MSDFGIFFYLLNLSPSKNRDEVSTHESKGSPVSPSYEGDAYFLDFVHLIELFALEEDADLDDIPVKPYIKVFLVDFF